MGEPHVVSLRATRDTDLDTLNHIVHGHGSDAAPDLGTDRRTVRADGEIVGDVACWHQDGRALVRYRIDGARRDDGIAGRALRLFVDTLSHPLEARIDARDAASVAVFEACGFERVADAAADRTSTVTLRLA